MIRANVSCPSSEQWISVSICTAGFLPFASNSGGPGREILLANRSTTPGSLNEDPD